MSEAGDDLIQTVLAKEAEWDNERDAIDDNLDDLQENYQQARDQRDYLLDHYVESEDGRFVFPDGSSVRCRTKNNGPRFEVDYKRAEESIFKYYTPEPHGDADYHSITFRVRDLVELDAMTDQVQIELTRFRILRKMDHALDAARRALPYDSVKRDKVESDYRKWKPEILQATKLQELKNFIPHLKSLGMYWE